MKKKNLFDLLALKEKILSNKYLEQLKPLRKEKSKVIKILEQLNELKDNSRSTNHLSGWELKSSSNIQEKIFQQITIAKTRVTGINEEIDNLEKKFIEHEIRKKRSIEKANMIKKTKNLENEKKIDDDLQSLKKVKQF